MRKLKIKALFGIILMGCGLMAGTATTKAAIYRLENSGSIQLSITQPMQGSGMIQNIGSNDNITLKWGTKPKSVDDFNKKSSTVKLSCKEWYLSTADGKVPTSSTITVNTKKDAAGNYRLIEFYICPVVYAHNTTCTVQKNVMYPNAAFSVTGAGVSHSTDTQRDFVKVSINLINTGLFTKFNTEGNGVIVSQVYVPPMIGFHYDRVFHTVAFDGNGGKAEIPFLKEMDGYSMSLPYALREGYELKGWSTSRTGGTVVDKINSVCSDAVYYAQWAKRVEEPAPPAPVPQKPSAGNHTNGTLTNNVGTSISHGSSTSQTVKTSVKQPTVPSVKTQKTSITVSLKKVSGAKGYQIRILKGKKTVKTVTTGSVKKAIKGLKGKTKYKVQVRAYKVVNGKKVYSKWSKVKKIKTK